MQVKNNTWGTQTITWQENEVDWLGILRIRNEIDFWRNDTFCFSPLSFIIMLGYEGGDGEGYLFRVGGLFKTWSSRRDLIERTGVIINSEQSTVKKAWTKCRVTGRITRAHGTNPAQCHTAFCTRPFYSTVSIFYIYQNNNNNNNNNFISTLYNLQYNKDKISRIKDWWAHAT